MPIETARSTGRILRASAFAAALAASAAQGAHADLEKALSWIPSDAVSFVAVPDLKKASDDVAALLEASGQGALLGIGRPIDILKAQAGVGANLDERAPVVAYYLKRAADAPAEQPPVFVCGVTDAAAFMKANLTPAPDKGEGAYLTAQGAVVFAKELAGRVVLAPSAAMLPAGDFTGIGERFRARVRPEESPWLERADLVAWAGRDALGEFVERAKTAPIPEAPPAAVPFAADRAQQEAARAKALEVAAMLDDGLVAIDIDPLGVFVASLGVARADTPLAALTAGGAGSPARFDRLPDKPFYTAIAVDVDGVGGAAKLGELLDFAGVARETVPAWVLEEGADIRGFQLAAYPSKLGVAIGGALNDSSLVILSRNPARTLARMKNAVESSAGESQGVRREPLWTESKTLKSGEVVTAFEIKETVTDAAQRPTLDIERISRQFIVGSAGLRGFVKQRADGLVVTFSQRPDVYGRALEAAEGRVSLARNATVQSLEEWLPAARDIEAMVGVAQLVRLASQIAASFVDEAQVKSMLPEIDADAEPVAVGIDIDAGRVRAVTVIPAAVIEMAARQSARANGAAP
jgi:hypothetical protein